MVLTTCEPVALLLKKLMKAPFEERHWVRAKRMTQQPQPSLKPNTLNVESCALTIRLEHASSKIANTFIPFLKGVK